MKLTYRGNQYETSLSNRNYLLPRAANWRYSIPGVTYQEQSLIRHYSEPQAINWRYQIPEMM
jgi:hypothetical protein